MIRFNVQKAVTDMQILKKQMELVKSTRKYQQIIGGKLKAQEDRKPLFQYEGDTAYLLTKDPSSSSAKRKNKNVYKETILSCIEIILEDFSKESSGKDKWIVHKDGKKVEISLVCHRTAQDAGGIGSFGTGKTLNSQLSKIVLEQLEQTDLEIIEANSNRIMINTDKNPISIKFTAKR